MIGGSTTTWRRDFEIALLQSSFCDALETASILR